MKALSQNTKEPWAEWKAQQKSRATPAGKEKRKTQSQRYRERERNRKAPTGEAADEAARISLKDSDNKK